MLDRIIFCDTTWQGCFKPSSELFRHEVYAKNECLKNTEYQQHFLDNIKREIIIFCLDRRLDEYDELAVKYDGNYPPLKYPLKKQNLISFRMSPKNPPKK